MPISSLKGFRTALALLVPAAAVLIAGMSGHAQAARLLVFELPDCEPCVQFEHDVGRIYSNTEEGRELPLVRLPFAAKPEIDVQFRAPIQVAPTFVLVHDGQEIGRFAGYHGDELFWLSFTKLLQGLPAGDSG